MKDQQIVELFQKREEIAIRHTQEKYGKRLFTFSKRITEDNQSAEECENDTYLETWNSIPPYNPGDYFFQFLAKIIRQKSLDVCRRRNRAKRSAIVTELSSEMEQCIPSGRDVFDEVAGSLLEEIINRFLDGLKEEQRQIFMRRYWYMDSVSEIASLFHISESKVKTTLFRLRNQLKEELEKEGYRV